MNLQELLEIKAEEAAKTANTEIATMPEIETMPKIEAVSYRNIRTTRIFTSKGIELKTKDGLFYPVTEEEKKLCAEYVAMGYLIEVK